MTPNHPRLKSLLTYWEKAPRDTDLPDWQATDRASLKPWMGNLNVVQVVDDGRDFLCRLHGTRLATIAGNDATGKLYGSLADISGDLLMQEYRTVYRTRAPMLTSRSPLSQRKNYIELEKLMLPFLNGGADCAIVLTGIYILERRLAEANPGAIRWNEALH